MLWKIGQTWCRAKPDALDLEHKIAWDLKTTPGYADAQSWTDTQERTGMIGLRAAHYLDGLAHCIGPGWRYRFWIWS